MISSRQIPALYVLYGLSSRNQQLNNTPKRAKGKTPMKTTPEIKDTSVTQSPMTIEVRVLVPYLIIIIMTTSIGGLIAGWFAHSSVQTDVKQELVSLSK